MNERSLISGILVDAPTPATGRGEGLLQILIDVPAALNSERWRVLAATVEANAEMRDLEAGDVVACLGWGSIARFPLDPLARVLTAERVLTLRSSPDAGRTAPAQPDREAINQKLEQIVEKAMKYGAALARARIAAIMNSAVANTNLALAWRLAEAGEVSQEAAEEALRMAIVADLAPHVGASGRVLEN